MPGLMRKPTNIDEAVQFIKAVTLETTPDGPHPQLADLVEALIGRSLQSVERELVIEKWLLGTLP